MYAVGPEKYLNQVAGLKKALNIPVIGSLNGVSKGGWTNYAKQDPGSWRRCTGTEPVLHLHRSRSDIQ